MSYLELGPTPAEEPCQAVGMPSYHAEKAMDECKRYIDALRITLGPEPPNGRYSVRSNPHDFGTYYEVAIHYKDDDEESASYAFRAESEGPAEWPEAMTIWTTAPNAYDGFGTIRPGEVEPQSQRNRRGWKEYTFHRCIVAPEHLEWQLGRYRSAYSAYVAGTEDEARMLAAAGL